MIIEHLEKPTNFAYGGISQRLNKDKIKLFKN